MTERSYPYHGPWLQQSNHKQAISGFYDVAVWRSWPPYEFALIADGIQASSPFQAIEQTMRAYGLRYAGHASACPCGGQTLLAYRAFGIRISGEGPSNPPGHLSTNR